MFFWKNTVPRFFEEPLFKIKKMKIIYTILFFADLLLLITLSYLFLNLLDKGISNGILILLIASITTTIGLLAFFLYRYTKMPTANSIHNF